MATLTVFIQDFAVDFDDLDLFWYWDNQFDSDITIGDNATINGIVYPDTAYVQARDPNVGGIEEIAVGGTGFQGGSSGLTAGRITGLMETNYNIGTLFILEGIDIAATTFTAALKSKSSADDRALLETALFGDDTFQLMNGNDRVYGFAGNDRIYASGGNDYIYGGSGNDQLFGGAGSDFMYGGIGNDIYEVASLGDSVNELADEGSDLVQVFFLNYTLPSSVENYILLSSGNWNATGNELANSFTGNSGNNDFYGMSGNDSFRSASGGTDRFFGGLGNDIFTLTVNTQSVIEKEGEGTDFVYNNAFSYTLPANVENLSMAGSVLSINGTGNALSNVLIGTGGNNELNGAGGNDRLEGGAGDDLLVGGLGTDVFVFSGTNKSALFDVVEDLNIGVEDTLNFLEPSYIMDDNVDLLQFLTPSGSSYKFINSSRFTNQGQAEINYTWDQSNPLDPKTVIRLDDNGNGLEEDVVILKGLYILKETFGGSGLYYGVRAKFESGEGGEVLYLDFDNPAQAPAFSNQLFKGFSSLTLGDAASFAGTTPAKLADQAEVVAETQKIFYNSGVPFLVTSIMPDAPTLAQSTTVKFASAETRDILGDLVYRKNGEYTGDALLGMAYEGIDRFNAESKNEVGIFFDREVTKIGNDGNVLTRLPFNAAGLAEVVAHEAAHSYGVVHIEPLQGAGRDVMDYDWAPFSGSLFNPKTFEIADLDRPDAQGRVFYKFGTHNNVYHLLKYGGGYFDSTIDIDRGLQPGMWDDRAFKDNDWRFTMTTFQVKKLVLAKKEGNQAGEFEGYTIVDLPIVASSDGSFRLTLPLFDEFLILGYSTLDATTPDLIVSNGSARPTSFSGSPSEGISGALYNLNADGSIGAQAVAFSAAIDASQGRTLLGTTGADNISGTAANDAIYSGDGGDRLTGGPGGDTIDGGSNVDTAIVSGTRAAYTVNQDFTGVFTVSGPDGTDTLRNVEFLQFADQTMRLLPGVGVSVNFETANPSTYQTALQGLRDFDGNSLGSDGAWLRIGSADLDGDGDVDQILVNDQIGRFATVGGASDGLTYFADHGWAGETRVVGIYIDPLVASGAVAAGGDNDSQRRFQNDLRIENINRVLGADDYDGDGLQEVYFALTDGTAYLHAYMHADGNIQYANYQSQQQVIDFLTAQGFSSETYAGWFIAPT